MEPTWTIPPDIPRVQLLDRPTPLERMPNIEALTGHRGALWVKRDDSIPIGGGGNKLRSLEFWLGEAEAAGADIVIVAGQIVSNQCRLAAAAAAKRGLECLIIHNSDAPSRSQVQGNHLLSVLMGASFRFVGPVSESERGSYVAQASAELKAAGRQPYIVGDHAVGALGYVVGALELVQQSLEMPPGSRLLHVVLPGSMGPTEAGFLYGVARAGAPFTVHLISIEYELDEMDSRIDAIYQELCARLGMVVDWKPFTRRYDRYLGDGYALPTTASDEAMRLFASEEGLLLETTYTAKTFAGALDLLRAGVIPKSEACCVLHTGGVPALFAQAAEGLVSGIPQSTSPPPEQALKCVPLVKAGVGPGTTSVGEEGLARVVSQLVDQIAALQQRVELLTQVSKEVLIASQHPPARQQHPQQEEQATSMERREFASFCGRTASLPGDAPAGTAVDWEHNDKVAAAAAGLAPPPLPMGVDQPTVPTAASSADRLVQLEDGTWVQPNGPPETVVTPDNRRSFAPFRGKQTGPKPKL